MTRPEQLEHLSPEKDILARSLSADLSSLWLPPWLRWGAVDMGWLLSQRICCEALIRIGIHKTAVPRAAVRRASHSPCMEIAAVLHCDHS